MSYIEREALIAEFKRLTLGEGSLIERFFADGVYAVLETFPTADVQEVKHGKWKYDSSDVGYANYLCSECKNFLTFDENSDLYPYCPYCGAKMNKE